MREKKKDNRQKESTTLCARKTAVQNIDPNKFNKSNERQYTMLRILHTGDIHLDSPFSGLDAKLSEIRRRELRAAFTSMLHYVRTEHIDLMLIAGDLFDSEFVTRETLALIKSEFSRLTCPVVISPGNHDPISGTDAWRSGAFPDNTYIFRESELDSFDFPDLGARVYGWAFTSRTLEHSPLRDAEPAPNDGRINILCAHGDLTSQSSTACPLTVREIEAFGADYAALGHIHNPQEYTDRIAYCGCLEGRAFDETGPKGAIDLTIDPDTHRVTARRVRFSKRRYETASLSVDGAETNTELRDRILDFVTDSRYGDDTLLRLTLTGQVDPSLRISSGYLENEISASGRLFALSVADGTSPMMGADELRRDPSLRGEFYRLLEPELLSDDSNVRSRAAAALRIGLAALAGEVPTEL